MADSTIVRFDYTNHKGKMRLRRVRPVRIWFGSTAFHPEAQWFLEGFDLDKQETRDFAMSSMNSQWERYIEGGNDSKNNARA